MYLLPYIILPERMPGLQQIWLFLERNGTHLIDIDRETEDDAKLFAQEFVELNEFKLSGELSVVDSIVFCPIDISTKSLADHYTWKETALGAVPPKELWRTFIWISATDKTDPLNVNNLMGGISLSEKSHTAYSVLKNILDLKP